MTTDREIHVLLVEDDDDIRMSVVQVLEDEGFSVLAVSNGVTALESLLAGVRPRVIVLDLMMPQMDGYTFLGRIKQDPRIADVPVVIVTADSAAADRAMELGAVEFLRKPFKVERLLAAIAPYHHSSSKEPSHG